MRKIKPLKDQILVERAEYQAPEGLLLTHGAAKDLRPQEGTVLAVGPLVPAGQINQGDVIIFTNYGGQEWEEGDSAKRLLSFSEHVLAVVDPE